MILLADMLTLGSRPHRLNVWATFSVRCHDYFDPPWLALEFKFCDPAASPVHAIRLADTPTLGSRRHRWDVWVTLVVSYSVYSGPSWLALQFKFCVIVVWPAYPSRAVHLHI